MPTRILPFLLKNESTENLSQEGLLTAQKELIEWYERFHENSTDLFFVLNKEGILIYCSKKFEEITGDKISDYTGKHFLEFTHTDEHNDLIQLHSEMLAENISSKNFDHKFLSFSGKIFHFNTSIYTVKNKEGKILYFGANSRQIDEELRLKTELNKAVKIKELLINKAIIFDELAQNNWHATIQSILGDCAHILKAEKAYILQSNDSRTSVKMTYEWNDDKTKPTEDSNKSIELKMMPEWFETVMKQPVFAIEDVEKATRKSPEIKDLFTICDTKSIIIGRLVHRKDFLGVIVFQSYQSKMTLKKSEIELVDNITSYLSHYLYLQNDQKKHRRNEELLNAFAENSGEGFAIVQGGKILYTSAAYKKILGYPDNDPIWNDLNKILNLIHPDFKYVQNQVIETVKERKTYIRYQFKIKHYLKKYIWQEDVVSIEYHMDAPPTFYIISRDITNEINTKNELEVSKQKYQSIIDAVPDLLLIISKKGEYKEVFEKPHHKLRYKSKYLLGKTIGDIYGKELHDEFTEAIKTLDHESNKSIVRTYKLPADKHWNEQYFEVRLIKYFDDILVIERDVTEFTKAQQSLEDERIKIKTIVNALPSLIYMKDTHGRKVFANNAERNFLNLSENDPLGQTDFDLFQKENAELSTSEDASVLKNGISIIDKEVFVHNQRGIPMWLQINKIPLKDNEGKIVGLVGISNIITDLKNKEEELRKAVDVMAIQNKRLQNFSYIVSHNIRSYASNISGLLELYKLEENPKERATLIDLLNASSKSLLDTINNLNEVIKVQNEVNINRDEVNLSKLMAGLTDTLKFDIQQFKVKINNLIPENTIVLTPISYMESILLNLITNAIKYRDDSRNPVIDITYESNDQFHIIKFSDNGLGIDLKRHGHKLFGMYQVFHSKKDARGLGLFITKNQIESIGGSIQVSSQEGAGTTFTLSIPKA